MKSYRNSVTIQAGKKGVFEALTQQLEKWWGKVDQPTEKVNDVFKISFGEAYWKFKITAFTPYEHISWKCVASNQVHDGLKGIEEEWLGTKVFWELDEKTKGRTEVQFHHEGLTPQLECYDVCSSAWTHFITDSLKNYLEKGTGSPEII